MYVLIFSLFITCATLALPGNLFESVPTNNINGNATILEVEPGNSIEFDEEKQYDTLPGLPVFSVPLPTYDVMKVAPLTLNDVSKAHHIGPLVDDDPNGGVLSLMFPGQFFTEEEIEKLGKLETRRYRRQLDGDICCRTKVWFGTAPKTLRDVSGAGPHEVLRAKLLFQAFARGECHDSKPRSSCPHGGYCKQKRRLHMLWVRNKGKADLKYFKVNSHCAYEMSPSEVSLKSSEKSSF